MLWEFLFKSISFRCSFISENMNSFIPLRSLFFIQRRNVVPNPVLLKKKLVRPDFRSLFRKLLKKKKWNFRMILFCLYIVRKEQRSIINQIHKSIKNTFSCILEQFLVRHFCYGLSLISNLFFTFDSLQDQWKIAHRFYQFQISDGNVAMLRTAPFAISIWPSDIMI